MDWRSRLASAIAGGGISLAIRATVNSIGNSRQSKKTTTARTVKPEIKIKGDNSRVTQIIVVTQDGQPTPESQPLVAELQAALENDEIDYVIAPAREKLNAYRQFEKNTTNNRMVSVLTEVLPPRHIALIKTGLYKRYLTDNGSQHDLSTLVMSLSNLTPEERHIVNLASSDHFHHYIYPAYKELRQKEGGKDRFLSHYYDVISGPDLALFVHRGMSSERIVEEVIAMARRNLKYGVVRHKLYVHAAGITNCETLDKAATELKKVFPGIKRKSIQRFLPLLVVKIPYQNNKLDEAQET